MDQASKQDTYFETLHETTLAVINRLDLTELLETIVRRAAMLLDAQHGAIFLTDEFLESENQDGTSDVSPPHSKIEQKVGIGKLAQYHGLRLSFGEGVSGTVWETGQPIILANYDQWDQRSAEIDHGVLGAILALPLKSVSNVVGVISLAHDAHTTKSFEQADINLLERFAELASVALDNARLYRTIQQTQNQLAERVAARTTELENVNVSLQKRMHQLQQTETVLSEVEEQHRLIVETALDAVVSINEAGNIIGWNGTAHTVFGWAEDEVMGTSLSDVIIPDQYREAHKKGMARFLATGTGPLVNTRVEITALHKDGHEFPVELAICPSRIREKTIFNSFIRDITERKRTQQLLEDYNRTLEQDVETRTKELSEALEDLKETQDQLVEAQKMAALGGLVAGVAHEINTPIGIGVTSASLMAQKTDVLRNLYQQGKMKRSDLEKYLDTAGESSDLVLANLDRAAQLIQSFKKVAVDQSVEESRLFAVKAYLDDVLHSLAPKLHETHHTIHLEGDDNLEIDSYPGILSQIVTNLVMNALMHAYDPTDEGNMTLNFTSSKNRLQLMFKDDGCGIPAENVSKIFDPFFTTKRGQGGSGLGLHIIYNLVTQKLAGSIRCESEVGSGTQFIINIPLDASL
ncbi:MAG: PAS domain S-box protein [Chloroflexota bacterium]